MDTRPIQPVYFVLGREVRCLSAGGLAIDGGRIDSVDDAIVTYLPELAGRNLDGVTIATC